MRLHFERGPAIDRPAPDQLSDGLRRLSLPDNSFAILDGGPLTYLQVAAEGGGRYLLEYQEGSVDRHYQATSPLSLDQVTAAFLSYLGEDARWRTAAEWRRIPVGPAAIAAGRTTAGGGGPSPAKRLGRRARHRPAAPARSGHRAVGVTIYYAVLIPVAAVFAALLLRAGITGALATFGVIGEPGYAAVAECHSAGRSVDCTGIFTPARAGSHPATVSIQGSYSPDQIRSGRRIPVHVFDGDAWPEGPSTAPDWVIPLGFGCFFVVAFVAGAIGAVRHWMRRRRGAATTAAEARMPRA